MIVGKTDSHALLSWKYSDSATQYDLYFSKNVFLPVFFSGGNRMSGKTASQAALLMLAQLVFSDNLGSRPLITTMLYLVKTYSIS